MVIPDPRIVLVETSHPGNIGAVARAMKNMAIEDLVLVSPKQFPADEATRRASGATDILDKARVVDSFDEAIEDCHVVVGASARGRKIPWPVMNPREVVEQAFSDQPPRKYAFVFGREDNGLSNEELQRCHFHLHIPANPEYSSLNLAMAVQVLAYEWRMSLLSRDGDVQPTLTAGSDEWDVEPAEAVEIEGMLHHIESVMIEVGFHNPDNPRQLMARLRRLFQRVGMDKMEVNIMRGFCKAVGQKLKSAQ